MTFTLTPEQERLVQSQLDSGRYTDLNDVISQALRLLIERDEASKKLESKLVEGLDSGEPMQATNEWWEQKKKRLQDQLKG